MVSFAFMLLSLLCSNIFWHAISLSLIPRRGGGGGERAPGTHCLRNTLPSFVLLDTRRMSVVWHNVLLMCDVNVVLAFPVCCYLCSVL